MTQRIERIRHSNHPSIDQPTLTLSKPFLAFLHSNSDEKQIDFAEQLESVAYVLCGDGTVTYDKFCQIWHAKGVSVRVVDLEHRGYRLASAIGTHPFPLPVLVLICRFSISSID